MGHRSVVPGRPRRHPDTPAVGNDLRRRYRRASPTRDRRRALPGHPAARCNAHARRGAPGKAHTDSVRLRQAEAAHPSGRSGTVERARGSASVSGGCAPVGTTLRRRLARRPSVDRLGCAADTDCREFGATTGRRSGAVRELDSPRGAVDEGPATSAGSSCRAPRNGHGRGRRRRQPHHGPLDGERPDDAGRLFLGIPSGLVREAAVIARTLGSCRLAHLVLHGRGDTRQAGDCALRATGPVSPRIRKPAPV